MAHVVVSLIFLFVCSRWLASEFRQERPVYLRHWPWLAGMVFVQLLAALLSLHYAYRVGNFLLHGIGGGIASALMFYYLIRTFRYRFVSWRVELAAAFVFVSALGVLNELAEYALELLRVDIFSWDSHDTWRDLVANTSGAILAWLAIKYILRFRQS